MIFLKNKRLKSLLAVLMLCVITISGCGKLNGSTGETVDKSGEYTTTDTPEENPAAAENELEVHFIDVGQGDCTLIKSGDHAMLIDAGDNSKGSAVWMYLQKQGIKKLDYVIGTHPDADHIGGLDVVIYKFDCEIIILSDYKKDTKTYDELIQTIKTKNYKITSPKTGTRYKLGDAEFEIIGPVGSDYGTNANNYSVGIKLVHGNKSFLFAGDGEEEFESDLIEANENLKADVYKVSHHGSKTASTEEFMKKVNPKYAVISCGEDNRYGHPHSEVLNRFRAMGIKLFRTDEQGTIVAKSDGNTITFNCSPSTSWQSGDR